MIHTKTTRKYILVKEEIVKTLSMWTSSFCKDSSDNICALYDKRATLWGTLSPIKRDNLILIKDYFDQLFKFKSRSIEVNESNIRVFGDLAICNGIYTFKWINSGKIITKVARFSFFYTKKEDQWLIVEHHSSVLPVID